MTADSTARGFIRTAPRGLPQYAHLLAQGGRPTRCSGRKKRDYIGRRTYWAPDWSVETRPFALQCLRQGDLYCEGKSFRRCALRVRSHPTRRVWFFSPAEVRRPYSRLIGESVNIDRFNPHLVQLTQSRGGILTRKGQDRAWRYRFSDSLMEPYVLLKGISVGRIKPEHFLSE